MVVCSEFVLYYFAGFLLEENSIHESRDRYIYRLCTVHITYITIPDERKNYSELCKNSFPIKKRISSPSLVHFLNINEI